MKCLELFTGAGGLAMGIGRAGFEHAGVVEFDHDACETMRHNSSNKGSPLFKWPVLEADVRSIADYGKTFPGVGVVAGGPPCQPFSLGGKALGPSDPRDMFPEAVRCVREVQPQAFIFENVKGLLREKFTDYFEYVILRLSYPSVKLRKGESAQCHRARLERIHTSGEAPEYRVVWQLLNAANFGVPQKRERVFIVGFRSDLRIEWTFPSATHSKESLELQKFVTGEYYERHEISRTERLCSGRLPIGRLSTDLDRVVGLRPWQTIRDAIGDLPDPRSAGDPTINHVFVPGARPYPGHTGSPIDEPAKTLKAGDHGVPGGENMVALPDGSVRYFTLREAARLQTFPDNYHFNRSWTESMRQLGNAVPVELGRIVGESVAAALRVRARTVRKRV